ncbi:hypothetical protein [Flavobacterium sp. GSB-24]|uniref:hypothetical protein n=1 Tax=Flavobacterium sp. GSB-24 TaxID=2994319 RepID=UPI002492B047|nr:hypothetical protein [Flavobacterium sp. GSB-24]BDU27710.1 hypothetical protein FLGSB24_44540 [Flavobacterium sp. GSB-24]
MNYFTNIPDQHLKEFFLKDLTCINNVIGFKYPNYKFESNDIEDEDEFFMQHLEKCKRILKNYIRYELSEIEELEDTEIEILAEKKAHEIYRSCDKEVQNVWDSLNMKEIHLHKKTKYYKITDSLILIRGEIAGRSIFHKIKNLFSKPRVYR